MIPICLDVCERGTTSQRWAYLTFVKTFSQQSLQVSPKRGFRELVTPEEFPLALSVGTPDSICGVILDH